MAQGSRLLSSLHPFRSPLSLALAGIELKVHWQAMVPTTPNSAATEHANVDNTEPLDGDATERAATTEVMTTPSVDVETCVITIGPCTLRCMNYEFEILCKMQDEINQRFRVPVSLEELLRRYNDTQCDAGWNPTMQRKSWSSTIEAISRCIAAFQKATDATEHSACQDIATKTCDYAIALAHETPAYCGREDLLALLHQFMENRTYNLAFTHLLNQEFLSEHERDSPFWSRHLYPPGKRNCLRIIERCMDAIRDRSEHLLREMDAYRR